MMNIAQISELPALNPNFCRFYIIRHGETVWNTQGRMQGHSDSPLTSSGVEQARQRAKDLATVPFAQIFSSDLLRAQRTAEIIALEHNLAVTTTSLLRERTFGSFEGKALINFQTELKVMLQKMETLSEKDQFNFKLAADIESDEEVVTRMITFLRQTAAAYPQQIVGVVCHGGIMRALLMHLGLAKREALSHGAIKNLCYAVVDADGTDFFVQDTQGIELQT